MVLLLSGDKAFEDGVGLRFADGVEIVAALDRPIDLLCAEKLHTNIEGRAAHMLDIASDKVGAGQKIEKQARKKEIQKLISILAGLHHVGHKLTARHLGAMGLEPTQKQGIKGFHRENQTAETADSFQRERNLPAA